MAENGSFGVNTFALNSALDIMTQNHSRTVLGALLPRLYRRNGQEHHGSQKGPARARKNSRGFAVPSVHTGCCESHPKDSDNWVPAAYRSIAAMETVTLEVWLSWWKPTKDENGPARNVVPTFRAGSVGKTVSDYSLTTMGRLSSSRQSFRNPRISSAPSSAPSVESSHTPCASFQNCQRYPLRSSSFSSFESERPR
jgi:hypothetical protein